MSISCKPVPTFARMLGIFVLLGAHTRNDGPPFGQIYERWIPPRQLSRTERQALRLVRRWGRERGLLLRYDIRLSRTARRALRTGLAEKHPAPDLAWIRRCAQRLGWTDGQLAAVRVQASSVVELWRKLRHELEQGLEHVEINRIGLAVLAGAKDVTALVLLSRRLLHLHPFASVVRPGARVSIAGRALAKELTEQGGSVTIVVARPGDAIERFYQGPARTGFRQVIDVGSRPGILELQLLLERGQGPESAVLVPIGVQADPHGKHLGFQGPEAPTDASPPQLRVTLRELVLGLREAEGLALPSVHPALAEAAGTHARDMCANGFFAHVSPTTGDVTQRLSHHGVRYLRALENIAAVSSAEEAFQQWLASPSHRANLLDPHVTAMGLGVAVSQDRDNPRIYAVLVLARLAMGGDDEQLAAHALKRINARRLALGLRSWMRDPDLERLAHRHNREAMGTGQLDARSSIHGHLVDTVFRELDVSEVAADVYQANSIDVVTHSPHLHEAFERVGISILRAPHRHDAQLLITVVYAAD